MGSGASSATPCLAGFFALRCFSLITIWVTPESWAVKLITSLPHWFYTRILRVPKCFPAVGPSLDANSLHNSGYMRLQQIVQPGGPSSFFKGDLQLTAQPVDKIQNDVRFRLDHTFHHELPGIIPDRNRNAFLVHVHADIFSASHKRVFLSGGFEASTQTLLHKGRPFILRRVTGVRPVKLLKMIVWRGGTRSDRASHRT